MHRHSFEWTRRTARPIAIPGRRVLLGSALPVDGRMRAEAYLRWVGRVASSAPVAYLPHRREGAEQLAAVEATPGVRVHRTGLPVELVLAGAREPLEVITCRAAPGPRCGTCWRAAAARSRSTPLTPPS